MSRGAPGVPLVILPSDGAVRARPHLGDAAWDALDAALAALVGLRRALRFATLPLAQLPAFGGAVDALRAFVDELPPPELVSQAIGMPASPVHAYFGVCVAPLTPDECAAQVATIAFRALVDLRYAPIDLNDAAAEIEAMTAMLAAFHDYRTSSNGARGGIGGTDRSSYVPRGDGLERWIAVHHLYFVLNLFAASAVADAADAVARDDDDRAAALLAEATTYVRGFSAAMVHSGAIASDYYGEVVRPTMQPPAVPVLLTGSMQTEHAAYRAALGLFIGRLAQPFRTLVREHRELAVARGALLDADLLDVERHICVAHALVRDDHSLVQHAQAPDNAVAALRRIRHARAARYCELVRYGDALLADGVYEVAR
jgi:hypothetical protein